MSESTQIPIIEVHNVYALHAKDETASPNDPIFIEFSRPQDWGDPRWHFERFKFEWMREDVHYINHAYCWTDMPKPEHGYPALFGDIIAIWILQPGRKPQLCGKDYLHPDDFWLEEWGEIPPYFDEDDYECNY